MQMKLVVDTPEEYKKWLQDKGTIVNAVKEEKAKANAVAASPSVEPANKKADTTVVAEVVDSTVVKK